jgi:pyruvate dehydrogenase E1 component
MLPVYIYYSMFGFQRVGDLIWAAADQRARGFLWGATAGRTTLGGEGLQHQDGSSLLVAHTVPNCVPWDPATAAEVAVITAHAARRMLVDQADEFHYLTMGNENQPMPSLPEGVQADLLRGLWRVAEVAPPAGTALRGRLKLLGSGAILREVQAAAQTLARAHGVACEVYSATSYSLLAREAAALQAQERADGGTPMADAGGARAAGAPPAPRVPHVARLLAGDVPVVAASDSVRAWPQLVAEYAGAPFFTLGTDGFGRSDTRQQLRRFFGVDAQAVVQAGLHALRGSRR